MELQIKSARSSLPPPWALCTTHQEGARLSRPSLRPYRWGYQHSEIINSAETLVGLSRGRWSPRLSLERRKGKRLTSSSWSRWTWRFSQLWAPHSLLAQSPRHRAELPWSLLPKVSSTPAGSGCGRHTLSLAPTLLFRANQAMPT